MKKKNNSNFNLRPVIVNIAIFLILVFAVIFFLPSFSRNTIYDYYGLDSTKTYVVIDDTIISDTNTPMFIDDVLYIPVDFTQKYIDKYIFWENDSDMLTITTDDKVIKFTSEETEYLINSQPTGLKFPVYNIENIAYMPEELLEQLYAVNLIYEKESNLVILQCNDVDMNYAKVKPKNTNIRFEPSKKSKIIDSVSKDDELLIFETVDGYTKVRTRKGYVGYIKNNQITSPYVVQGLQPEVVEKTPPIEEKIVLLWDQVTTVGASKNVERRTSSDVVNVVSPTWFSFDKEALNGDMINIADIGYVNWAHEQGYQVWPLITDNFDGAVSHAVLSDPAVRDHVIKQILVYCATYNLDGINFDFERVLEEDGAYYTQLLRELYPYLKKENIILSVDTFVPRPWTAHYNKADIAETVDYIAVMTYDEHTKVSDKPGPVASLDFVEDGIAQTLVDVPNDKVLLGIPFYCRVWKEYTKDGVYQFEIENFSMNVTYKKFIDNGATFVWDDKIGSYYSEYSTVEDGINVTYKVWLEDPESISKKMEIYNKYDLAGIACWKNGLETSTVWEEIRSALN